MDDSPGDDELHGLLLDDVSAQVFRDGDIRVNRLLSGA
jgi:hypothetical protein